MAFLRVQFISVLIVASLFSLVSHAQASLTAADSSCRCDLKVEDPLEQPQRFAFGKFNGQCIDSCRFRPVHIFKDEKTLRLGNILHYGKYYEAQIPLQDLDKIEVGFEEFVFSVYHVFLKFTVKKNSSALLLKEQLHPEHQLQTRSLVISSEGVPPKDHKYSLWESFQGHYLLAHRLVTGDELTRWLQEYKHPVVLHTLQISDTQVPQIFQRAIQKSASKKLQDVYQLFSNNCSTSSLGFIDEAEALRPKNFWEKFEESLSVAGPLGTLRILSSRGLIKE
ncbi:DUF4105 domain-containing protein [Bdellovibrio sp. HCB-162]|uniref:DUF4105 domain-containing protein n=1 Tax=Bdellovibrio sp. HCB-162 TaxID=3394234 RepID=UPI0039BD8FDF